nr:transposase [Neobacillus sp. Marseille-Q6967]
MMRENTNQRPIKFIHSHIRQARAQSGDNQPIVCLIIDDSQCKKDRSTTSIEGLDNHFSHSEGKSIWSHCVVTVHVVCENTSFAKDFRSYFREEYCTEINRTFKSKNDLAVELIHSFASHLDGNEQVYVLVDAWYKSRKLVDSCLEKAFHLIGGLKANRKIYPHGIGIKISEFATKFVEESDLHSVTVNGHDFKIFTYKGHLSDTENAKVLLSWDKGTRSNSLSVQRRRNGVLLESNPSIL